MVGEERLDGNAIFGAAVCLAMAVLLFASRKQSVEQTRRLREAAREKGLPPIPDRVQEAGLVVGAAVFAVLGVSFLIAGLVDFVRD